MGGLWDSDVLNKELFTKIASKIDGVTPEQLSDYLGFKGWQGSNAKINPTSPYVKLLLKFERKHGKDGNSALKLRSIFLKNDMVPCVELVEEALRSYGIKFPSRADTLRGLPSNPPSPPHHTPELVKAVIVYPSRADTPTCQDVNPPSPTHDKPELEKTGIVNPSPADTLTGQDVNPPSPPHDKPGSETPVVPTPRGLKPLGHPEELQQQPPSISRGMIADTVNSQALDLPSSSHVKPGSETPVAATPSDLQPQPRDPPGARQQQQPYFGSGWILAVVFVAIFAVIVYFVNVKVP